jgi:hypothetical protein
MADEATPDTGNGTPTPESAPAPTATDPAAIRASALAAGFEVFDPSEMHGFKTKVAEKAEKKLAEAQAQLAAIQAENEKFAAQKKEQDSAGQSDSEKHRAERNEWRTRDEAAAKALKDEQKATADLKAQLNRERVQNRISALMPDAGNLEMAQMWADKHVGERLSTDESGQLVWTDPAGIPYYGVNAANQFNEWWQADDQKFLRTGNPPGPPTSGATSAPAPQPEQPFKRDPAKSAMENYLAAEAWDAQQRGKQ